MISNINIRKYLFLLLGILALFATTDVILSRLDGSLGDIFSGYSVVVIPLLILVTYIYIGLPLFTFDGESEILHVRSHMVLNRFLGKDLYVPRRNIVSMTVDTSGLRKKLVIRYIKNGQEFEEKFGITLLSRRKLDKLSVTVKNIDAEVNKAGNPHMFI